MGYFEGLTGGQLCAVARAYEERNFEIPSKCDLADLSKNLGILNPIYGVHIKKPIKGIIDASC